MTTAGARPRWSRRWVWFPIPPKPGPTRPTATCSTAIAAPASRPGPPLATSSPWSCSTTRSTTRPSSPWSGRPPIRAEARAERRTRPHPGRPPAPAAGGRAGRRGPSPRAAGLEAAAGAAGTLALRTGPQLDSIPALGALAPAGHPADPGRRPPARHSGPRRRGPGRDRGPGGHHAWHSIYGRAGPGQRDQGTDSRRCALAGKRGAPDRPPGDRDARGGAGADRPPLGPRDRRGCLLPGRRPCRLHRLRSATPARTGGGDRLPAHTRGPGPGPRLPGSGTRAALRPPSAHHLADLGRDLAGPGLRCPLPAYLRGGGAAGRAGPGRRGQGKPGRAPARRPRLRGGLDHTLRRPPAGAGGRARRMVAGRRRHAVALSLR